MDPFNVGLIVGLLIAALGMCLWFLICLFASPSTWTADEAIASAGTGLIFMVLFAACAIIATICGLVL